MMQTVTEKEKVEAKAKRRVRHEQAIEKFQAWLKTHPDATHEQKMWKFDDLVDGD